MSNSTLVTYTKLSPNCTRPRNHKIDTITIHCTAGQGTAKSILNLSNFVTYNAKSGSSCNYAVGKDGSIGLCVDEANRSWCSSNAANDHRAVTIEVSSDAKAPYAVTDAAYAALLDLLTDICKRNGIKQLLWRGDKKLIGQVDKQNMTVHRWFANKACPGDWLYERHGTIAEEVNRRLRAITSVPYTVRVQVAGNIYQSAGSGTKKAGTVKPGVYTIVEERTVSGSRWGRLKSGAGWIELEYAQKI